MTYFDFKSDKSKEATFNQRYPIVCWTDFLISSIIIILLWMYYIGYNNVDGWMTALIQLNPTLVSILGFLVIGINILLTGKWLIKQTKQRFGDEDTY